ncbi:MAG: biotin synthase BioB [Syntrophales bacterium]|nr:biotin synthase BioB [Syntrophales bacterium]
MNTKALLELAETIIEGKDSPEEPLRGLATVPMEYLDALLTGAELIREHFFGKEIHLCSICNGKSGRCSENCSFCSQSSAAQTDIPVYPLLGKEHLQEKGRSIRGTPIHRYSVVTSGKRLPRQEVAAVADALAELAEENFALCASLGTLDSEDFRILKDAGLTRYHHNLETAESHFSRICTTHTYLERVETIEAAKEAGLSICAGGIFGVGETDDQVIELAFALKSLRVDAVPVNFLVPREGTLLGGTDAIPPLRCLKIVALLRFILPKTDLFVCGGRESALRDLHPLIFSAGASGIMTNDYLTTAGRSLAEDLELLERLDLRPRPKIPQNEGSDLYS